MYLLGDDAGWRENAGDAKGRSDLSQAGVSWSSSTISSPNDVKYSLPFEEE